MICVHVAQLDLLMTELALTVRTSPNHDAFIVVECATWILWDEIATEKQ